MRWRWLRDGRAALTEPATAAEALARFERVTHDSTDALTRSPWISDLLWKDAPMDLDFSDALERLKEGAQLARSGWNGTGMYVERNDGESSDERQLPYLQMLTAQGDIVPWLASQTDLLAEDWYVVRFPEAVAAQRQAGGEQAADEQPEPEASEEAVVALPDPFSFKIEGLDEASKAFLQARFRDPAMHAGPLLRFTEALVGWELGRGHLLGWEPDDGPEVIRVHGGVPKQGIKVLGNEERVAEAIEKLGSIRGAAAEARDALRRSAAEIEPARARVHVDEAHAWLRLADLDRG